MQLIPLLESITQEAKGEDIADWELRVFGGIIEGAG